MNKVPHILIIGGGLIGLSTAYALRSRGCKVSVMEAHDKVMQGASFSNSAMIHLSQAMPWVSVIGGEHIDPLSARHVLALAQRSKPLIAEISERLNVNITEREVGCLQVFSTTAHWKAAQAKYDELDIAYKRQPAGGVLADMPALYFPDDHSGDALLYGQALARDLDKQGAEIITGKSVELYQQNGRVKGVRLGQDIVKADHIVLTAGAGSASIAKTVGLSLPLMPITGFALDYALPDDVRLPNIPVMHAESRSCLTVFENRFRLSGTVGQNDAEGLREIWAGIIPALERYLDTSIAPEWKAQRPGSLLGRPLIGRSSVPGLWLNTGHAHMGWTLCAGAAALMADMIVDGQTDGRFAVTTI